MSGTSPEGRRAMLRIAYLGDPNSVHTRRWISFFADRGHAVFLLDGFGAQIQPGLDPRVTVHRYRAFGKLPVRALSAIQGRWSLRRLLHELRPDLLHAHFLRRYGWQARLSGFRPYVISAWGSDVFVESIRTPRTRWWDRRALRAADLVTVVSEPMRTAVLAAGAHRDRVRLVHFGVDTSRFSPGVAGWEVADRLGLGGRRVVLSPRAARPLYRHEVVLAAFASLPDDLDLVMTARGADPDCLARLRRQAVQLRISDRLVVIDDISDDDLLALYRLAGVVVSVPESDAVPVTLLEAMACGTPVVASDVASVRAVFGEVIADHLVPVGDAAALCRAMDLVLELSTAARDELGRRLRRFVVDHADQETNMLLMEGHYRALARSSR